MNWKEELVEKIYALKPEDFIDGRALITVPFSMPWGPDALFLHATNRVNLYPVGWVGPGYLLLDGSCSYRNLEDVAIGVLNFIVSRDRKHNEVIIEDVFTGQVGKLQLPFFDSIDFLSL